MTITLDAAREALPVGRRDPGRTVRRGRPDRHLGPVADHRADGRRGRRGDDPQRKHRGVLRAGPGGIRPRHPGHGRDPGGAGDGDPGDRIRHDDRRRDGSLGDRSRRRRGDDPPTAAPVPVSERLGRLPPRDRVGPRRHADRPVHQGSDGGSTDAARAGALRPNVVGVKYAVGDVVRFAALVETFRAGDVAWVCGLAEPWAPFFWVAGATGFTSGLANVDPALSLEMLRCLRDGDYDGAMGVWRSVKPFEDLRARRNSANNVPVVKEALAQLGLCDRRGASTTRGTGCLRARRGRVDPGPLGQKPLTQISAASPPSGHCVRRQRPWMISSPLNCRRSSSASDAPRPHRSRRSSSSTGSATRCSSTSGP